MNEKKETVIGTNQKIIIEYIFDNPRCTFVQLKKEFKGKMSLNNLKFYLRGKYDTEGKYEEAYLIRIGHIISYDKDKYGGYEYPDIFEVDETFIKYYPDLMKKTYIKMGKELENLVERDTKTLIDEMVAFLGYLMGFGISAELIQSPFSEKIFFSDNMYNEFGTFLELILYECFFNNPDIWYIFKKREDLDFSVNIKIEFSKIPFLFEYLILLQEAFLNKKDLYETVFLRKYYSLIKSKRKNRRLEHNDVKTFYAKAKFEHETRNASEKKQSILEKWIEYLKKPTKEYFKDKTKNEERKFQNEIQENIKNILNKNTENDLALLFEAFGEAKGDPNYFREIQEKLKPKNNRD